MKRKKWFLLLIPVILLLAAAAFLFWNRMIAPKAALSAAIPDALTKLEKRWEESPIRILAAGYDENGKNTTMLSLTVSDGVQYDMQVQTDLNTNQIFAEGAVIMEGSTLNVSAYLDRNFAAITSQDLLGGGYYGITYDTFSSDVRSFPMLSRLIPSATLGKWDSSVAKLQAYMNRSRQLPKLPDIRQEDIRLLMLGVLALKSDISREEITVDGESRECCRIDYKASGEQVGSLLGSLLDSGDLSHGEITASFYLYEKTLVSAHCVGKAGEDWIILDLKLGLDASESEVSFAVEKQENGEGSAFSFKVSPRRADGSHEETIVLGYQVIAYNWDPDNGDMLLHLPEKEPIALNLTPADEGFCIRTKDFAVLMGIDSKKDFDSTMTVSKGAAITVPDYKNLDEWSFGDLLVLLGGIGSLLGLTGK